MPARTYCKMQYSDIDGERQRYETSLVEMNRLLAGLGTLTFNGDYVWPADLPTAFRPLRNPHAESRIQLYCANQLDPPAKDPRSSRPVWFENRKQPAAAPPPRREKDNEPADSF